MKVGLEEQLAEKRMRAQEEREKQRQLELELLNKSKEHQADESFKKT